MSLAVTSGRQLSREGLVRRPRLLAKLGDGHDIPVVVLVAPAGYGKTSLLADWAEQERRPSVWLALEDWHNDPIRLTREIVSALEELNPLDTCLADVLEAPTSIGVSQLDEPVSSHASGIARSLLPMLAPALERIHCPIVVILDDVQVITDAGALQVLTALAEHLPAGSQLVLASRTRPALPLGRLRAHRALLELGAEEMAMTRTEAASLLAAAHVRVGMADATGLVERTEGWPAALYLAALSARDQPDPAKALARFAGDDHTASDFLRDECLSELSVEERDFLVGTSVLELLSGPLCDAVLDRAGSAGILDRIASGGLPVA